MHEILHLSRCLTDFGSLTVGRMRVSLETLYMWTARSRVYTNESMANNMLLTEKKNLFPFVLNKYDYVQDSS